ncbi:MAG: site-specific integrase [Clostridia bacterium]|nr:site-specific integrase [Clostridia bacterium]
MPRTKKKDKIPAISQLPSGSYRVQIYIGKDPATGKKLNDSFTDKDYNTVVHWAIDRLRDRDEGTDIKTNPSKMTFGEALDKYIESKSAVLSPSTIREYKRMRKKCLPSLMHIPVNKLRQQDIQVAINIEAADHSAKTVRNIHGLISAVLSIYRPDMPLKTTLPQKEKTEIEIPTDEEVKTLLDKSKGLPIEAPLYLAACCGMRRSEICALRWSDVDFNKNTITIKGALVYDENDKLVMKTTKTMASTRTIPMIPVVEKALARIRKEHSDEEFVTSLSPNTVYNRYVALLKQCGIKRYRFHSLRHYTVSVMLLLNVPKMYIADYVGHNSENMINQVYGHIMKGKKTGFTDRLNDYFAEMM